MAMSTTIRALHTTGTKDGLSFGPDEDWSCSPAYTMKKRAADFGKETDGVSNALSASEAAMVSGLAALQASDSEDARKEIITLVQRARKTE